MPIEKLITNSKIVEAGYMRYAPVNNTFLDMQSSGNTNLLNELQRHALIELSSRYEQLQIIIEKLISSAIREDDEKGRYLGYPDNFYEKLGKSASNNDKLQWLIH